MAHLDSVPHSYSLEVSLGPGLSFTLSSQKFSDRDNINIRITHGVGACEFKNKYMGSLS